MKKYLFILVILMVISFEGVFSQSLSVNLEFLNEYYRRQQLLGNVDPSISFTNRPLFSEALNFENIYDPDDALTRVRKNSFTGNFSFHKGKGKLQLLPISLLNQFNSHHPEGINDGSMIPSKGTQLKASAGFYLKYGPLSIKFKPEFVYAQNKQFDGFPQYYTTNMGIKFPASPYRSIDLPERFGNDSYHKIFWGQSSIKLTFKSISFGLSNENLWWGPGYRNTLLMTNSASGFLHLSVNTVKPLKTFIGSFEGQIIGGKLESSAYANNLTEDWRYINALILSYQPKWVPGLFLGTIRSFVIYRQDIGSGLDAYLPAFSLLSKSSSGGEGNTNAKNHNQLISIFMRWLFKESHAEIYIEYGREDHSWDTRDFLLEPSHSSAFIIGFRKLFILNNKKNTNIQIISEISNLASSQTSINRDEGKAMGVWYQHTTIKHGYTHNGQLLGASIGPGSNLQTLEVSWNKSFKRIGVRFERFVHNNDFWYDYIKDFRSNWVDLSIALFGLWDYKNFILTGKMKFVNSKNYQWLYEPELIHGEYWLPSDDTFNFHLQVGINYRF